jgi:AraC-like DNA-binding protein
MLVAYSSPLWDEGFAAVEPDLSRYVVSHICDLVALCAGASGDAAAFAVERGGKAARLQAVKAAIEGRVGPVEFSAEDVAAEVGVSARYVRKLLEAEGTSFSRFVAERRLARAHAMLTNPKHDRLSVAAIAFEVGFGDLSYFNRTFRRAFDCTPSDLRSERGQRSAFPL